MKRSVLVCALALFTFAANSFANHDRDRFDHRGTCDLYRATDLAYRLADMGENYTRSYDYRLARAANDLHHSASDLYYTLRGQGGGFRTYDHNGGGWGFSQQQERVRYAVNGFAQVAPYQLANQAVYLYNSMQSFLYCY